MDLRFLDQKYDLTNELLLKEDGRWTRYGTPESRTGYELVAMLAQAKRQSEMAAENERNLRVLIDGLFENEVEP